MMGGAARVMTFTRVVLRSSAPRSWRARLSPSVSFRGRAGRGPHGAQTTTLPVKMYSSIQWEISRSSTRLDLRPARPSVPPRHLGGAQPSTARERGRCDAIRGRPPPKPLASGEQLSGRCRRKAGEHRSPAAPRGAGPASSAGLSSPADRDRLPRARAEGAQRHLVGADSVRAARAVPGGPWVKLGIDKDPTAVGRRNITISATRSARLSRNYTSRDAEEGVDTVSLALGHLSGIRGAAWSRPRFAATIIGQLASAEWRILGCPRLGGLRTKFVSEGHPYDEGLFMRIRKSSR